MIDEVEYLNKKDIKEYGNFIKEIFEYDINRKAIEKLIDNELVLIIKDDKKIVASCTLEKHLEYVKNKKFYHLGYLGVLKDYRRKGYASKLFEKIEQLVTENDIDYIELTSGNQRRIAHYFYKSQNFKVKDTTVFIKIYK